MGKWPTAGWIQAATAARHPGRWAEHRTQFEERQGLGPHPISSRIHTADAPSAGSGNRLGGYLQRSPSAPGKIGARPKGVWPTSRAADRVTEACVRAPMSYRLLDATVAVLRRLRLAEATADLRWRYGSIDVEPFELDTKCRRLPRRSDEPYFETDLGHANDHVPLRACSFSVVEILLCRSSPTQGRTPRFESAVIQREVADADGRIAPPPCVRHSYRLARVCGAPRNVVPPSGHDPPDLDPGRLLPQRSRSFDRSPTCSKRQTRSRHTSEALLRRLVAADYPCPDEVCRTWTNFGPRRPTFGPTGSRPSGGRFPANQPARLKHVRPSSSRFGRWSSSMGTGREKR